ncbi:hypothetical protein WUBG_10282 [Wuchereria bancrofti]|uniref:Uncharacterized protein n=1 Tax=Wuchereria bancrofti TaxID=6293 RepID=J9EP33_WUCBA|nr:hypothetical protein WUBG_10282 [Wuchereria bancrofti]VDM07363.1 unnamed protein product [Wuchereria bancrofti]
MTEMPFKRSVAGVGVTLVRTVNIALVIRIEGAFECVPEKHFKIRPEQSTEISLAVPFRASVEQRIFQMKIDKHYQFIN